MVVISKRKIHNKRSKYARHDRYHRGGASGTVMKSANTTENKFALLIDFFKKRTNDIHIMLNLYDLLVILIYLWFLGIKKINELMIQFNTGPIQCMHDIQVIIGNNNDFQIKSRKDEGWKATDINDWIYKAPYIDIFVKNKQKLITLIEKVFNIKSKPSIEFINSSIDPTKLREQYLVELDKCFINPLEQSTGEKTKTLGKTLKNLFGFGKKSKGKNTKYVNSTSTTDSNGDVRYLTPAVSPAKEPQELKHFWFKDWPDHGVPDMVTFNEFIKLVYEDILATGGMTVIHCSAGVGRTGVVYIVLLIKLLLDNKLLERKDLNMQFVLDTIKEARNSRMWLVQRYEQYEFICNYFEIPKNLDDAKTKFENLSTFGSIEKTPEDITDTKFVYTNEIFSNARKYPTLNRYKNILPYNVKIPIHEFRVGYINASYMAHIFKENLIKIRDINFITAQCPTLAAISHFLDMLIDKKVKRVIMVTNLKEKGEDKCDDYFGMMKDTKEVIKTLQQRSFEKTLIDEEFMNFDIQTYTYAEIAAAIAKYPSAAVNSTA